MASAHSSRPNTKRSRFNEELGSKLMLSPPRTAGSSVMRFSRGNRSLASEAGSTEFPRIQTKRPGVVKEDTHSEKAESIKSRLIDAISKMDETDIEKLRTVLKLDVEPAGRPRQLKKHRLRRGRRGDER